MPATTDPTQINWEPVSYHDRLSTRPLSRIQGVVIHCTELPNMDLCREYAEKIHHTDSQTGNCGHFYLDKEGQIFQFVEVTHIAHHVRGLNERTLGIELINQGRYPHWFQSDHQSVTDPYPDSQIQSLVILLRSLQQKIETLSFIAGHEDLDRAFVQAEDNPALQIRRKIDPGPLFPWDKVMQAVRPLQRVTEL